MFHCYEFAKYKMQLRTEKAQQCANCERREMGIMGNQYSDEIDWQLQSVTNY